MNIYFIEKYLLGISEMATNICYFCITFLFLSFSIFSGVRTETHFLAMQKSYGLTSYFMFFLRRKPPYSRICKRLHATILFLLSIIPLPDNQRTMQKPCQLRCGGNGRLCKQAPNPRLARARKSTPYTARPRRFFMGLQTNNDIVTIAERM